MHVVSPVLTVFVLGNLVLASAGLYLLPVLIGWIRKVPDIGSVAVVNVLLGWTLIGWAAALAMALRSPRPPGAAVQIIQNLPINLTDALAGETGGDDNGCEGCCCSAG